MKDELKKYTQLHRQEFEIYRLDIDQSWGAIESQLEQNGEKGVKISWKGILRAVAIFLVLITVAFGYYLNQQRMEIYRYGISLQDLSSDLADTEAFYAMQIDEKLDMIKSTIGNHDPGLLAQLEIFDADYESLRKDLNDNADSEEVIYAMTQHYRLKLQMLEKILNEIQKDSFGKEDEELQAI